MHLMRKDWATAAKAYNAVVALQDMKHDPYARVGLATIQLYSMPHQQMVMLRSRSYHPLFRAPSDAMAGSTPNRASSLVLLVSAAGATADCL